MAEEKSQEHTKKPMGKPKKGPIEMAEYFYNQKKLFIVFCLSSIGLVACLLMMQYQDWKREWKDYQRTFKEIERERAQKELELAQKELDKPERKEQMDKIKKQLQVEKSKISDELAKLLKQEAGIENDHYKKRLAYEFTQADFLRIRNELQDEEGHYSKALKEKGPKLHEVEKKYKEKKKEFEETEKLRDIKKKQFEEKDKEMQEIQASILRLRGPVLELEKEETKMLKEINDIRKKLYALRETIDVQLRDAPFLDFFGPSLKVQQQLLPNVYEDLNFVKVTKVDRCQTCHISIDNPSYQLDEEHYRKGQYKFKEESVQKLFESKFKDKEDLEKYTKLYMAHPRLDLYTSSTSPHPIDKMGCTVCHGGDGRETDFTNTVHFPRNEEQEHKWQKKYNWTHRELWDYPMVTKNYLFTSCRQCHSQDVEIKGADPYNAGMLIYERAGCYACHKTDTYPVLDKHLPKKADGKPDETKKIRRPGPPLKSIHEKNTKEWAFNWILSPRSFRYSTTMPHFFGQSNARSVKTKNGEYKPQEVEEMLVNSMVDYLFSTSEQMQFKEILPNLTPDPDRGEKLVNQIGCMACHSINEDKQYDAKDGMLYATQFAPNLAGLGDKFTTETGKKWLYNWLLDPKHYFKQTRMPNFRLTEQDAVDMTDFLLSLKIDNDHRKQNNRLQYISNPLPDKNLPRFQDLLDALVFEQLKLDMRESEAEAELKKLKENKDQQIRWLGKKMVQNYGCYSCHDIKGFEDVEGIGVELTGTQPIGSKFVDRLDFGLTKYDGVNYHGIKFKHAITKDDIEKKIHHTRHDWVLNKILDPRIYDGGLLESKSPSELLKMPNFNFSQKEAELVSNFILSFTNSEVRGLVKDVAKPLNEKANIMNRGHRLIREYNCKGCHRFALEEYEIEVPVREFKDGSFKETIHKIKLEGTIKTEDDIQDRVRSYLRNLIKPNERYKIPPGIDYAIENDKQPFKEIYPSWVHNGSSLDPHPLQSLTALPKYMIKRIVQVDGGEIIPHIKEFKKETVKDEQTMSTKFPPLLRTQGVKTDPQWLYNFLKNPHDIRPNLHKIQGEINVKMPTFEFNDEQTWSLVRYFYERDKTNSDSYHLNVNEYLASPPQLVTKYLLEAPPDAKAYLYTLHPVTLKWLAYGPKNLMPLLSAKTKIIDKSTDAVIEVSSIELFMQGQPLSQIEGLKSAPSDVIAYLRSAPPEAIKNLQTALNPFNDFIKHFGVLLFIQDAPKELHESSLTDIFIAFKFDLNYIQKGPKELKTAKAEDIYNQVRGKSSDLPENVKEYLKNVPDDTKSFIRSDLLDEKTFSQLWDKAKNLKLPANALQHINNADPKVKLFFTNAKLDLQIFLDTWAYLVELQKMLPKKLIEYFMYRPESIFDMNSKFISSLEAQKLIQGDKKLENPPEGYQEFLNKIPNDIKLLLESGMIEKVRRDPNLSKHLQGSEKFNDYLDKLWAAKMDLTVKKYLLDSVSSSLDYISKASPEVLEYFKRGLPFSYEMFKHKAIQWAKKFVITMCSNCHLIDGKFVKDVKGSESAPDLAQVSERLRPRWLEKWIETPRYIYPTIMPDFIREKDMDNSAGGPHVAYHALLEYLLTFNKYK